MATSACSACPINPIISIISIQLKQTMIICQSFYRDVELVCCNGSLSYNKVPVKMKIYYHEIYQGMFMEIINSSWNAHGILMSLFTKSDELLLSRNKYCARKINIKVGKYTLGSERTKDTHFSLWHFPKVLWLSHQLCCRCHKLYWASSSRLMGFNLFYPSKCTS